MNKKVYKVFNEQVQAELYSAYMYLAMSLDMEAKNYKGMAKWLYLQYEEEREHALRFVKFMQDCGVQPQLLQIDMPAADYGTPLNLFKKVLEHEKYVTSRIYDMYEVALKEKDYAAQSCLKWFIDEQVEEEANASEIVEKLEMIGDNISGLFYLDDRNEKIGYQIREAQLQKVPYMLVIGDKEVEDGTVAVRRRGEGDIGAMKQEDFIAMLQEEIADKK